MQSAALRAEDLQYGCPRLPATLYIKYTPNSRVLGGHSYMASITNRLYLCFWA